MIYQEHVRRIALHLCQEFVTERGVQEYFPQHAGHLGLLPIVVAGSDIPLQRMLVGAVLGARLSNLRRVTRIGDHAHVMSASNQRADEDHLWRPVAGCVQGQH